MCSFVCSQGWSLLACFFLFLSAADPESGSVSLALSPRVVVGRCLSAAKADVDGDGPDASPKACPALPVVVPGLVTAPHVLFAPPPPLSLRSR